MTLVCVSAQVGMLSVKGHRHQALGLYAEILVQLFQARWQFGLRERLRY